MNEALSALGVAVIGILVPLVPYVGLLMRAYLVAATRAATAKSDATYNDTIQAGLETIVATAAKAGAPKVELDDAVKTLEARFPDAMSALKPSTPVLSDKLTKAIVDVEAKLATATIGRVVRAPEASNG